MPSVPVPLRMSLQPPRQLPLRLPSAPRRQLPRALPWRAGPRPPGWGPPAGGQLPDEGVGLAELLQGLLEIDDVDAVALPEDVFLHLGVPPLGLVAEVNPGLQKLLHRHCHSVLLRCASASRPLAGAPNVGGVLGWAGGPPPPWIRLCTSR